MSSAVLALVAAGACETKYFSGIAEYETVLQLAPSNSSQLILDFGDVHDVAEVLLDGKSVGILWRPPYRLDLTDHLFQLKHPSNSNNSNTSLHLRLRVANCWPNRLIGDAAKPLDRELNATGDVVAVPEWVKKGEKSPTGRHSFTFHDHWRADEPLLPAGLLGPVYLETIR